MQRYELKPGDVFKYSGSYGAGCFYIPPHPNPKVNWVPSTYPDLGAEVDLIESSPVIPPKVEDPSYYKNLNPEPIDVTEGWGLNPNLASVIWYIARAGKKTPDAKADLLKAC